MEAILRKHAKKLRFAVVGGTNTVIDFGILFLLTSLGLDKIIANYISTSVALSFSFIANKKYTFKSEASAKHQIIPFLIVTLIGLWIIQPLIIWGYTTAFGDSSLALFIGKLLATVASLIWNYLLYARFVFTEKKG